MLSLIIDHFLPFLCLTIDYIFVNTIPILKRHSVIMIIVITFYWITNFIFSKVTKMPVYQFIDFNTAGAYVIVFFSYPLLIILIIIFECLTKQKLKFYSKNSMK
jgi:hypothetical protein